MTKPHMRDQRKNIWLGPLWGSGRILGKGALEESPKDQQELANLMWVRGRYYLLYKEHLLRPRNLEGRANLRH